MKQTVIGIIGGIGSGKSYISKIFKDNLCFVYDCDSEAKEILNTNTELKQKLSDKYGALSYKDNKWNREYIVELCTKDPNIIDEIGKIIEPYMVADFIKFKTRCQEFVGIESAILTKSKSLMAQVDKIVFVDAPFDVRMERIRKRDTFRTEKEIEVLLNKQKENPIVHHDYVIMNDGETNVKSAVEAILRDEDQFQVFLVELLKQIIAGKFKVIVLNHEDSEFEARVIGYNEKDKTIEVEYDSDNLEEEKWVDVEPGFRSMETETKREWQKVPIKTQYVDYTAIKFINK